MNHSCSPYWKFFGKLCDATMEIEFLREFASGIDSVLNETPNWANFRDRPLPDVLSVSAENWDQVYCEQFTPLLHDSFIVTTVIFLEHECRSYIEIVSECLDCRLKMSDLKGSPVEQFRIYCEKVAQLNLQIPDVLWEQVIGLVSIRNCIVHCYGALQNERDVTRIRRFAEKNGAPTILNGRIACSARSSITATEILSQFVDVIYDAALRRFPEQKH